MLWREVRLCSAVEANLASGLLEDAGFHARVVTTSGDPIQRDHLIPVRSEFRVIVEVPDAESGAALAFLELALPNTTAQPAPAGRGADEAAVRATAETAALGRLIRYLALTPFAPIGLWMAKDYVARTSSPDDRPAGHAWNVTGMALCAVATVLYGTLLYVKLR